MTQDYRELTDDQHELLEKQTLRTLVQALQEYSKEAKLIFETTEAHTKSEVIVLAEDLVQYALEVAECYPINKRFAGFIDYKRVRWLSTPFGLFPQALLVDAKASTENFRDTLQQSQLPMDADFINSKTKKPERLPAGFAPHLVVEGYSGTILPAVTTSVFIHYYYKDESYTPGRYRRLISIFALLIPHARLKPKYNPNSSVSFFAAGKHSPKRLEEPRVRVQFGRLRRACQWRVQQLTYPDGDTFTHPVWRDADLATGGETETPFAFIGR